MSAEESKSSSEDMRINPQRAEELSVNLSRILTRMKAASANSLYPTISPRLIAVSKLKPASDILALHNPPSSHLHFGENYVQELVEKSSLLPTTINWHFIGALQTNKCKILAESVPNLYCVSSVDSIKKADRLDLGRSLAQGAVDPTPLKVMVQVNTSGEESKSGAEPGKKTVDLCRYISKECKNLWLIGLMTIGAIARSNATTAENENEDFERLKETRDLVEKELNIASGLLDLSMGMSSDFEGAIQQGSNEVRIGTDIFGERPAKEDAKVIEDVAEGED